MSGVTDRNTEYGNYITNKRIALGYSLRKFCLEFKYDCGNFSRMERGVFKPFEGAAMVSLIKNLKLDYCEGEHLKELAWKELWPDKEEIRKLKLKETKLIRFIESYCCCSILGAASGQCCFCDDIEEFKNELGE